MRLFNKATPKYQPKHLLTWKSRVEDRMPKILIATGIVVLLAAGAVQGYNFIDDYLAGRRAQDLLAQIRSEVPAPLPVFSSSPAATSTIPDEYDSSVFDSVADTEPPLISQAVIDLTDNPVLEESIEEQKPQYETIGVLSIPKLTLELPVLSECNDNNLKVSVCRYLGEALDNPERLVIAGHNYKSHFGNLSKLNPGDEVAFQSNDGSVYSYTVKEITIISMYDHEALELGEWDISLFTCDSDRSKRILVRCVETPIIFE